MSRFSANTRPPICCGFKVAMESGEYDALDIGRTYLALV